MWAYCPWSVCVRSWVALMPRLTHVSLGIAVSCGAAMVKLRVEEETTQPNVRMRFEAQGSAENLEGSRETMEAQNEEQGIDAYSHEEDKAQAGTHGQVGNTEGNGQRRWT